MYEETNLFKSTNFVSFYYLAVNLYLSECTNKEHNDLMSGNFFMRINMYYEEDCNVSCISVKKLTIDDLNDKKFKELITSVKHRNSDVIGNDGQVFEQLIPCEIHLGPYWHLFGISKFMFEMKHIEAGINVFVKEPITQIGYIMGLELFGRDVYPSEDTEEKIKDKEKINNIFIIRK